MLYFVRFATQVQGTADFIREKLTDCPDPIVVFVWFKDTSSLLKQNLEGFPGTEGKVKVCCYFVLLYKS
jgi:hypothetical protein